MNYIEYGRTNYVEVEDLEAVERLASRTGGTTSWEMVDGAPHVALLYADGQGPYLGDDEDDPDAWDKDIPERMVPLLKPGEVLVYQYVGFEGMRYVAGHAVAVNSEGLRRDISLDDIYTVADELAGPKTVHLAEY